MQDQKPFYVYVHRRATDGRVFYVGKGKGGRAWWHYDRNQRWNRTVAKYGFTAHIVMRFDREECAFSFERALIKHYGRENLCNMTDGGDGVSGYVFTDDVKERMSKSHSGEKHHMFGKKHSDKSIDRMIMSTDKKEVSCSNGMIFVSAKAASEWLLINHNIKRGQGNISSCARGERRVAYGYKWEYTE